MRLQRIGWLASLLAGGVADAQQSNGDVPGPASPARREFSVRLWNSEDGLPQNFVRAILQTRDGYLWLGTQFGLVRFDGTRFTTFDRYNTPEMGHDTIGSLAEDAGGNLWIGAEGGLIKFAGGRFEAIDSGNPAPKKDVRAVIAAPDGVLWLMQDDYVARFSEGAWVPVPWKGPGRVRSYRHAGESSSGELLLGATGTLLRFDLAAGRFVTVNPPGCPEKPLAWHAQKSRPGSLWVLSENHLHHYADGHWDRYPTPASIGEGSIQNFLEDRTGSLWIASKELGLLRFCGGRLTHFDPGPAVGPIAAHSLCEDREGNLWVGTESGLLRLTPVQVRTYTTRDNLDDNSVWSVSPARAGGVWAATRQGFNWIHEDKVHPYPIDPSTGRSTTVQAVVEDPSGMVWLGRAGSRLTRSTSVVQYRNGKFTEFNFGQPRNYSSCRAIHLDRSNRVWLASNEGVVCWQDSVLAWHPATEEDPFYGNVRAIYVGRDESLWMASFRGGLRRHRDGQVTKFDLRHQLASDAAWAIYEDTNNVIWAGTENGLVRIENDRVFLFDRRHGLAENVVNQILEDDDGNLWLSGLRGIHRARRAALDEVAAGRTNRCHVLTIGESEGMENAETNGENQPAGCKTADGRLWFPTIKGVVVIDAKSFRDNQLVPPVVVEQVSVDDEVVLRHGINAGAEAGTPVSQVAADADEPDGQLPHFRLAPGRARVMEINYVANSLTSPERVRFKHRLFGHDPGWRDAGDRRHAIYTNLRPGDYRFQVLACNNHGYWNDVGAGFTFSLAPHLHQTWQFWVACSIAAVAVAAAVQASRLRTQRRFLRLQQEAELERVRARIAEDMHDDVGASLSQIAILSEVARRDLPDRRGAETSVERISVIARGLVDSLSELVWATNPRNDTLDNMTAYFREFAASYFEPTTIQCRLDFPPGLPALPIAPETRRAAFLVLKEALHNVVKHSGATQVTVTFRLQPDGASRASHRGAPPQLAELLVEDNGQGLATDGGRTSGNGLRNMRARMGSVGGTVEISSDPGRGMKVHFAVPVRGRQG